MEAATVRAMGGWAWILVDEHAESSKRRLSEADQRRFA
jgi:hypothetical protein